MGQLIAVSGTTRDRRSGDVIFVHGLDGDARATWEIRGAPGTFWPEWLGQDLPNAGIWSLDYDAASLAWRGAAMPLVDRATNVLDLFETRGIGSRPLVFIAHSLGGLLVKQLLRHAKEYNNPAWTSLAANTKGIVFLATPHSGSDKAGWVKAFGVLLRPNDTIIDLQPHAPQLRDLNKWYQNNVTPLHIQTKVYAEGRSYNGLWIVDQTSADPGVQGVVPVPVDFDHIGISKLQNKDQRYEGILNFTRRRLNTESGSGPAPSHSLEILRGLPTKWADQVDAFRLQYLGTPGNPAPFGGREKHLQWLTAWLHDDAAPRYALIAARAGLGKSALLARWVDGLRQEPAGYSLFYFPISARWQTNSESAFFTSLAFRLAHLFDEPAPQSEDVRELREVIRTYLRRAVEDSRRLLLVIDGLDEAAGWEAGTDFLPPRSRGNVRALVAARPLGDESRSWLSRLGWSVRGVARPFALDELDRDGVADVLRQMGDPLRPLAGRLDVVETLFDKSQGDPLVVGLYVNLLREHAGNPLAFDKRTLERIEPGVRGFFQFWFEDQARLWGENRHEREPGVRALLALCSLAHGPLRQEDVQELNPELFDGRRSVEAAAKDLERLMIGDGRRHGYVFSHPRLGEFVREDILEERERRAWTERFLGYGTRAVDAMTQTLRKGLPEYVVRWYSTHLVESGATGALFLPLLDVRWCAEWERVDGTPAGFLSDLEKAWQVSGPDELGVRIRVALLRSSILTRGRIRKELFGQCIAAGVISPALAEAMARQQADPDDRYGYWLALVSSIGEGRRRFLQDALSAARQIGDEFDRAIALNAVAERLSEEDREKALQEALAAARQIGDEHARAIALSAVAERLGGEDRELLQEALSAARQIGNEFDHALALSAVAERLGGEDRETALQEALAAARQIGNESFRAIGLSAVAEELGGEDREKVLQEALAAAQQIVDDSSRARALSAVAERLGGEDRELLQGALAAARQIADEYHRSIALSAVAERVGGEDRELLQGALAAARQIGDEDSRAKALNAVAERLGGEDRERALEEALAAARQIGDEDSRAKALSVVAERLGESDREKALQEALSAARQIGNEYSRAWALSAVAERLGGEDRELLQETLAAARQIGNEGARSIALSAVAERVGGEDREKALQEALAAARQIGDGDSRAMALSAVAERLGREDREKALQEALAAARQTGDEHYRVWALSAVAERLGGEDRELLKEALAAARQIGSEDARARALSAVAERLGGADREKALQEALSAARQIGNEYSRAIALSAVAKWLGGEDREEALQEALAEARQIGNEDSRASALSAVAERLGEEDRELLQEALAAARQIGNEGVRARALSAVAERLDGEDREKALQDALAAARQIGDQCFRAGALSAVAKRLGGEDREKALQEALAEARQIGDGYSRARALSAVAERLGGEDREKALQEALAAARQIGGEDDRARVLSAVAQYLDLRGLAGMVQSSPTLVERPEMLSMIERVASVWGEFCRLQKADPADALNSWLLRLSRSKRSHLVDALQGLTPVIETIGGTAALRDMVAAMADAGRWWP